MPESFYEYQNQQPGPKSIIFLNLDQERAIFLLPNGKKEGTSHETIISF